MTALACSPICGPGETVGRLVVACEVGVGARDQTRDQTVRDVVNALGRMRCPAFRDGRQAAFKGTTGEA